MWSSLCYRLTNLEAFFKENMEKNFFYKENEIKFSSLVEVLTSGKRKVMLLNAVLSNYSLI